MELTVRRSNRCLATCRSQTKGPPSKRPRPRHGSMTRQPPNSTRQQPTAVWPPAIPRGRGAAGGGARRGGAGASPRGGTPPGGAGACPPPQGVPLADVLVVGCDQSLARIWLRRWSSGTISSAGSSRRRTGDGADQFLDAGDLAAPQGLAFDDGDEDLDQVEPGGVGRVKCSWMRGWASGQAWTRWCLWVA